MITTYGAAAEALQRQLPSPIERVEVNSGFFTLFGRSWHIVVFCHWWLQRARAVVVDGDLVSATDAEGVINSLRASTAVSFSYDVVNPKSARLAFADGRSLWIETDSDYEPWTLVTPDGEFTAALSDFD